MLPGSIMSVMKPCRLVLVRSGMRPRRIRPIPFPSSSAATMIMVLSSVSRPTTPASSPVSYTHLRAHETRHDLVCRLLLEKKKKKKNKKTIIKKEKKNKKKKKKKEKKK